jgi:hypothetical protein
MLTEAEWSWITGSLVFLQRKHPGFLAAGSWYRKGLMGRDSVDDFCCFWKAIERLSEKYADRTNWSDEEKRKPPIKKCIGQLMSDLFDPTSIPEVLADSTSLSRIKKLRDNVSHGNTPITVELIDEATGYLKPLENAAFTVLHRVRETKLTCDFPD